MLTSLLARIAPKFVVVALACLALPVGAGASVPVSGRGLDRSFAGGALAIPSKGFSAHQLATRCMVTPSGRTLVAVQGGRNFYEKRGAWANFEATRSYVFAYDSAGRRDKSFGRRGVVRAGAELVESLVDWQTSAAGQTYLMSAEYFARHTRVTVSRLTPHGRIDKRFGTRGVVVFPVKDADARGFGLEVLSDGRIAVTSSTYGTVSTLRVLLTDGTLDPGFGVGGKLDFAFNNPTIAALPAGEIALAGQLPTATEDQESVAVRILTASGQPATTWGDQGTFTIERTPASLFDPAFPTSPLRAKNKSLRPLGLAPTANGGLSIAIGAMAGAYSLEDSNSFGWFGLLYPGGSQLSEAATHFFGYPGTNWHEAAGDFTRTTAAPDGSGGWAAITVESVDPGQRLSTQRVTQAGQRAATSASRLKLHSGVDIVDASVVSNGTRLLACGTRNVGSDRHPRWRSFVFRERLSSPPGSRPAAAR